MRYTYFVILYTACVFSSPTIVAAAVQQGAKQLTFELTLLGQDNTTALGIGHPAKEHRAMSIALGMPVLFRLTLVNDGLQDITLLPSLDPSFGIVQMYVINERGEKERLTVRRWEIKDVLLKSRTLKPGEQLRYESFLFGRLAEGRHGEPNKRHMYLFNNPGTYQLVARYKSPFPVLSLESNPATIVVGQPIKGWSALKEAGIIALIEGDSRTDAAHEQRLTRVQSILDTLPNNPYRSLLAELSDRRETSTSNESSLSPELRDTTVAVFRTFFDALAAGNIKRCLDQTSDDFRGWNRAKQRQEFQEEIDEITELRHNGIHVEVSVEILSAVWSGKDVMISASLSYRQGSDAPDVRTVHYLLRKYGDEWRLHDRILRP